jgi:glyoxylase-like metal-dependent hydrolase (beta-lactamase superfamily II)
MRRGGRAGLRAGVAVAWVWVIGVAGACGGGAAGGGAAGAGVVGAGAAGKGAASADAEVDLGGGVRVRRVADRVWLHTSFKDLPGVGPYPSNGLVVAAPGGAILVDTAWTGDETARLLDWVRTGLGAEVRVAIVTHSHEDRVGGVAALAARGIEVRALPATIERAHLPATRLAEHEAGSILGEPVEIDFPGPAHAPDNLVVWFPRRGVLFGGCMVRAAGARDLGNLADADLAGWRRAIARVTARYGRATLVVPGHGAPGGAELLRHTRDLLEAAPTRPPGG